MEGVAIDDLVSRVISGVHTGGIPYPGRPITAIDQTIDYGRLLGKPLMEIRAKVDNVGGRNTIL